MISNSNSCFLIVGNCHFGCLHLIFEFSTLIIGLQVKISANPDSVMSYCTLFRSHGMHDCAISVPSTTGLAGIFGGMIVAGVELIGIVEGIAAGPELVGTLSTCNRV